MAPSQNISSSSEKAGFSTAIFLVTHLVLVIAFVFLVIIYMCKDAWYCVRQMECFRAQKKCDDEEAKRLHHKQETFHNSDHLAFPTKCFSCERQFPDGQKWRGQSTFKLFRKRIGKSYPEFINFILENFMNKINFAPDKSNIFYIAIFNRLCAMV